MTATEIQKRSERAQQLRVLQTNGTEFYVESAEGKILYRVYMDDNQVSCTCGDFARNQKSDPNFRCKHIMAVDTVFENGDFQDAEFIQKRKPRLDDRFIISLEGRDFVLYSGLLDLAHQKGVLRIEVETLQLPDKENGNFAICKATVVSKAGETFIDIGDANPGNCNSRVAKHLLRMASTRSIARALRSFTNIGMTCLEELADISDAMGDKNNGAKGKKAQNRKPGPAKKTNGEEPRTQKTQQTGKENTKPKEESNQSQANEPAENQAEKEAQVPQGENNEPGNGAGQETAKESPATQNASQSTKDESSQAPKMSEAQTRAVHNLSRRRGISLEDLEAMAEERYHTSLEHLTAQDASEFIRHLQQAA